MDSNYPEENKNAQQNIGANYGANYKKNSENPAVSEENIREDFEEIPEYEAPPVISRSVVDTSGEKSGSNKKLIIICITIILLVAIIAASIVFAVVSFKNKNTGEEKEEAVPTEETVEEEIEESTLADSIPALHTVLLSSPDEVENNVDMIMLLIFNHEDKKIDLLSIPRDTMISGQRLCEAVKSGNTVNMTKLKGAVESITGIPVDAYMHMPISYVKDTVDIFGDVYFYVPQHMNYADPAQDLYINLYPGYNYLDGNEAEQLLRYRGYLDGDIDRTGIQRNFMIEAFRQKATSENLSLIPDWYSIVGKNIRTNMDEDDIESLATAVVDGDEEYEISDNIIPYSSFGEDYFYCDKAEMRDMAKELGF